ncbi:MAG TPA: hypothetical protein VM600_10625 [Actinomycetota bacterium]|nr:hypothetical protein [Actinomycetota bacterium]
MPAIVVRSLLVLSLFVGLMPARAGDAQYVEHHMFFRSMATGNSANPQQLARCQAHMADRTFAVRGSNLDYRVWSVEVAQESGLIVNHNGTDMGPGFLCSILPDLETSSEARSYAYMEFPGLPEIEVEGPCKPTATVNTGETFWHCKLHVLPNAANGVYGGVLSTNSVLLIGASNTQWPTGSVWTGYVVTGPVEDAASGDVGIVPAPAKPYGDGGQFVAAQERDAAASTTGDCARHFGVGSAVQAVRGADLVAPVTDRANAHIRFDTDAAPSIGSLSVCYLRSGGREHEVLAVARLRSGNHRLTIEAAGVCKEYATPLRATQFFQSCSLHITGPRAEGVRSGTITSGGLVGKSAPAGSIAPHVWTAFVVRD